jgi:hypothetical protein
VATRRKSIHLQENVPREARVTDIIDSTLHNPNVSEEAKERAEEKLDQMGVV